jgi:tetratricopeptide (TPR) repeat protein
VTLTRFGSGNAEDRELGIGYAILAQREKNDTYRRRAFEHLEAARQKQRADSEVLLYLADLYNQRSRRESAIALYEQAIRMDPSQLTGSVALGAIRMEQGRFQEAIELWTDALAKNPALMLVRGNLAAALLRVGDRAGAKTVLDQALSFNPEFLPPRWLSEQLSGK